MEYKQAIVVRMDIKMPKGKLAAQVAHASLESAFSTPGQIVEWWRQEGAKKVVLKVPDLKQLRVILKKTGKVPHSLITDAGKTVFKRPTITCLGIGPAGESEIDAITDALQLL